MEERSPQEWDEIFWDIVVYEPAHDPRLVAAARYILLGETSALANDEDFDYSELKEKISRAYELNRDEFDYAYCSAERSIEKELFNGQA